MRPIARPLLALALLLALSPVARAEDVPLTPSDEARIERGEIVVKDAHSDSAVKRAVVIGTVDASPALVYRIFTDFDHYKDTFKIDESRVLSRDGNHLLGRFRIDFPWPVGARWTVNDTYLDPPSRSFTFKKRESNFNTYEGSVRILGEPGGRCRVVYDAWIDPALPVPPWLLNWANTQVFPNVIKSVRSEAARIAGR